MDEKYPAKYVRVCVRVCLHMCVREVKREGAFVYAFCTRVREKEHTAREYVCVSVLIHVMWGGGGG